MDTKATYSSFVDRTVCTLMRPSAVLRLPLAAPAVFASCAGTYWHHHSIDCGRIALLQLPTAQTAVLFVRPRGWHLLEKHMLVDGQPVPAAIFDFALFFFHNAKELLKRGTGELAALDSLANVTSSP